MSVDTSAVDRMSSKPQYGESFFVLDSASKNQSLQFIQHSVGKDSQKQKELRLSELRAHAARIAHHNKRKIRAQKIAEGQDLLENSSAQKAKARRDIPSERPPDPISFALSQSRRDPFGTSALSSVSYDLLELLDFAWINLKQAFRPEQRGLPYTDVMQWRREIATFPAISYSVIAGAATMSLTNRKHIPPDLVQSLQATRLQYTSLAVTQVRKELAKPGKAVSDALLFAVFCLGTHDDTEPDDEEFLEDQIVPPYLTGSVLHLITRLKTSSIHFDALNHLLRCRGGLDTVELPVWKEMMSYVALVQATKYGIRPRLPFVESQVVLLSDPNPNRTTSMTSSPTGFAELLTRESNTDLLEALKSAAQVTRYIEQMCKGCYRGDTYKVNELRNQTQYFLTNLMPKASTADSNISDCVYEICRLTALTFSDMIIFPTPALTKVRKRLADQLLSVLRSSQVREAWKDHSDFLTWATTIGLIGSKYLSESREAFTKIFDRMVIYPSLTEFLAGMERFLWSDLLDSRAQTIWTELRSYQTPESLEEA